MLIFLAWMPTASAQAPLPGAVVGEIEVAAPENRRFVLHATMPVPRGTFPRSDGLSPLMIEDSTGALLDTQVEAVTYYPGEPLDADVIELMARVKLPNNTTSVGQRVTYKVRFQPHNANKRLDLPPQVTGLINSPGSIKIRARDVFGNVYMADLNASQDGMRFTKSGMHLLERRFHEAMRPVPGTPLGAPTGALNHLFGVHSYVGAWNEENLLTMDLRVHNGSSGLDGSDPIDNPNDSIYYESLEILVPQGWKVMYQLRDPGLGSVHDEGSWRVFPLIQARTDGKMHVMPVQGQFHRRLAIVRPGLESRARMMLDSQTLGFCRPGQNLGGREYWSWWNEETARYFPQRHRIPDMRHFTKFSLRSKVRQDLAAVESVLINGSNTGAYPFLSNRLGYAHPWGVKYGGMASGTEIFFYSGIVTAASASYEGYRLAELKHRMYTDRHPVALFNKDGDATQLSEWIVAKGTPNAHVNMSFFLRPIGNTDPFGFHHAPSYQVNYVQNNGLAPGYQTNLFAHDPIDTQHFTRYTTSPKVLVWLGNDSLAKDDLLLQAELVRLSYHHLPNSAAGFLDSSGMAADRNFVNNRPAVGFAFGRGEGWSIDTMAAAYSFGSSTWRRGARNWFNRVLNLVEDGQSQCTGIIQSLRSPKFFNNQLRARASIEQAITENGLWSMKESVYGDALPIKRTRTEAILRRSLNAMISFPSWKSTGGSHGPWTILAVAPVSLNNPPFCSFIPQGGTAQGVDAYQTWASFAYGYELTGDPMFLTRATEMPGIGSDLLGSLQSTNYNNLENRAALLALMETNP